MIELEFLAWLSVAASPTAVVFEFRVLQKGNELAAVEAGEMLELEAGQ